MDYDDYVESPLWEARRRRYWERHQRICAACGTAKIVELHHMEYDPKQRGEEPDEVLLPLCNAHHREVHRLYDTSAAMMTLRQATARIVEDHGGRPPPTGVPMREPRNTAQWLDHVSARCPTCAAAVGEPCVKVNMHGRRQAIRMVHQARKTAAGRQHRR